MLYTARAPKATTELDFTLLWLALGLLCTGLVMVYSASIATAEAARYTGHNGYYYLIRQTLFIGVGLSVGAAAFQVPMRALSFSSGFTAAGRGVDPGHRPRCERQPPLDSVGFRQSAAVRVDEISGCALRRRLHHA
jgi:hypothetical protein